MSATLEPVDELMAELVAMLPTTRTELYVMLNEQQKADWRRLRVACHEASHYVVHVAVGAKVDFIEMKEQGGGTVQADVPSKDKFEELMVYAAGIAGEGYLSMVYTPDVVRLGHVDDDLKQCARVLAEMGEPPAKDILRSPMFNNAIDAATEIVKKNKNAVNTLAVALFRIEGRMSGEEAAEVFQHGASL